MSAPRPEPELAGLVYSLTPKPVEADKAWYMRPTVWALAVLAMAVVLNIIFVSVTGNATGVYAWVSTFAFHSAWSFC